MPESSRWSSPTARGPDREHEDPCAESHRPGVLASIVKVVKDSKNGKARLHRGTSGPKPTKTTSRLLARTAYATSRSSIGLARHRREILDRQSERDSHPSPCFLSRLESDVIKPAGTASNPSCRRTARRHRICFNRGGLVTEIVTAWTKGELRELVSTGDLLAGRHRPSCPAAKGPEAGRLVDVPSCSMGRTPVLRAGGELGALRP